MTSGENLNRILRSNKAKKVNQLSEIAKLFEAEKMITNQLSQIEQFSENIEEEIKNSVKLRRELPTRFLELENKKRDLLLDTVTACRLETKIQAASVEARKAEQIKKLSKLDYRIESVEDTIGKRKAAREEGRDLLELEEV